MVDDRSSPALSAVSTGLDTLDSLFNHVLSTVFNDREANKFIDIFRVDAERLKKDGIEVSNNPYLLHCFSNTVSNHQRFNVGLRAYAKRMRELARRFICTLDDPVYASAFNGCLALLECARHNVALNPIQLQQYSQSYLQEEYLMELERDGEDNRLKFLFPHIIVTELKNKFDCSAQNVLALPIVKGYVFEGRFLQCNNLHHLTISTVREEAVTPKTFMFSSLVSATVQETQPIQHRLADNQIYHLRPKHPAIDGVCVAIDSNNVRCLLLLQVSIGEYKKHESKGIHIRKKVETHFEGKFGSATIAEYYKKLTSVEEDENVIYVCVTNGT